MCMRKGKGFLLLIVLASLFIGQSVGEILSNYISIFGKTINISILSGGAPWVLDLSFVTLTFGLVININLGSIVFLMLALAIYYRN